MAVCISKTLAANIWPYRLWLTTPNTKRQAWDSLTLMHPKRTILCARLMLSMAAFNYLAFLLISYPALGIILQSHLALQTSMQGRWKPHFLLWPSMGSNELQSALSSQGSAAQNSLLRFLIVQTSRRPGHLGDKKDTFESSLGKKIFVQSECPHKCDLTLHSWKPGKMKTWRPGGLHGRGEDLVR